MDKEALINLITTYKTDPESVYNTWFVGGEGRMKAFRSIRRGVRDTVLAVVPKTTTRVEFKALPGLVAKKLSAADRKKLGLVEWYTTTVKLDLEVKKEKERVPGSAPSGCGGGSNGH